MSYGENSGYAHSGTGPGRAMHDAPVCPTPDAAQDIPRTLPTAATERKGIPMATGLLDYFPAALAEVARLSQVGNGQHNPGEPLHWARGKSMDQADCLMRHLAERGTLDSDGILHDAKVAWRALAMLQIALEARGAPISRGSWPTGNIRIWREEGVTPSTDALDATYMLQAAQQAQERKEVAAIEQAEANAKVIAASYPPPADAWKLGWLCRCGSTHVSAIYTGPVDIQAAIQRHGGPYCYRIGCKQIMGRAADMMPNGGHR